MQIDHILMQHYPGAQWSLGGTDYTGLEWYGPGVKPTEAELTALWFAVLKDEKIASLKAACRAACFSGYTSSALGSPHLYETEQDGNKNDQINLTAIHSDACANLATPGWTQKMTCTEISTGIKARRAHTAAQARDVAVGAKAMIDGHLETLWTKIDAVNAATTVAEVEAISW